jgi:glycyl-tRNA synthetase beta chain
MAELLLELFSEEIPARMQVRAADDLKRLVTDRLKEAGLDWTGAHVHSTPRRLTLVIDGLPTAQPDVREERRGPRADAPEKAIEGFLNSAGLTRDQVETREEKKGTFLYAVIEKKGGATADVIRDIVPAVIAAMPWPKSQRWGDGSLQWVRPLQRILCVFDGQTVAAEIDGLKATNQTSGHRFMAPAVFTVADFADYKAQLQASRVVLDRAERARMIEDGALALVKAQGLELVEDRALLDEVVGLVEWPVPLIGRFDKAFLDVPEEVLTATMRGNQKYFSVRDPQTGKLAPHFVVVANMETADKGAAIVAGNERVLNARLSDAKFFWDQDLAVTLDSRVPDLDGIIFHEKLGTVGDKVRRMEALAEYLAPLVGADAALAKRAAHLAKADLVSGMVGEFPEVQGVMGRYYAIEGGEDPAVAEALADHYKPLGPGDACPTAPVSVAVALADKIDTLVGFFGIDERPTGSKDPYALRRAALGVIRLIVENGLRISLGKVVTFIHPLVSKCVLAKPEWQEGVSPEFNAGQVVKNWLLDFFADRLKVQQREQGVRHDLIDAVIAFGREDDLVRLLARVDALSKFLATDDGANLLAGFKRATNIVRIEEKKDQGKHRGSVNEKLLKEADEKALHSHLSLAGEKALTKAAREDFEGAMAAMAALRAPVDAFFDNVTVNCEDAAVRENRLKLLSQFGAALGAVADFSKIEG